MRFLNYFNVCRLFIAHLLREVGKSGACKHVELTISCYIFIPPCDKAHWIKLSMAFTRSNWYSWLVVLVFSSHATIFHICDGIDVQADRRSCTCGRAPNAIDISNGSLTSPVQAPKRDLPFYGYSEKPPHLVTFYDTLGIRRNFLILNPGIPWGIGTLNIKL